MYAQIILGMKKVIQINFGRQDEQILLSEWKLEQCDR